MPRSKAELLELYNEYQAEPDKMNFTEWTKYLKISATTFSKWKKGIPPKLPKAKSTSHYNRYKDSILKRAKLDSAEASDERYDYTIDEIADRLGMTEDEVLSCYKSGMMKINKLIKERNMEKPLREQLDGCEQIVIDTYEFPSTR